MGSIGHIRFTDNSLTVAAVSQKSDSIPHGLQNEKKTAKGSKTAHEIKYAWFPVAISKLLLGSFPRAISIAHSQI
jgi:hypothetical protein